MQTILYYSELKEPAVDWIFSFCSLSIGCRFRTTPDRSLASVVYSNEPTTTEQFRIPIWHDYYNSMIEHCLSIDGYWVPLQMQHCGPKIDYLGLVYRLLTLSDERIISANDRDQFGNVLIRSGFPRSKFCEQAMVDVAVQAFKQELVTKDLLHEEELLPRWPNGKRYAVLLTHDTDGPCLLEPGELAKAGIKGILRSNSSEMKAFLEGCRRLIQDNDDPYFNFTRWATFEANLGTTSAIYLYVKSKKVPGHLHNPLYRLKSTKPKWRVVYNLAERGWEIGLHASIHGLESDEYIQSEKRDLEDFLGRAISGNRSHYWTIDWENPINSFRRLEGAGFMYDLSLAWKDMPGFRSGTSLPYYPYDPESKSCINLLEIPTSLMDGHLFDYQSDINPHLLFDGVFKQIRELGGVLNLDWHIRTWVNDFSYKGWRDFLIEKLTDLADTSEAWFTTPGVLSEHWFKRLHLIQEN